MVSACANRLFPLGCSYSVTTLLRDNNMLRDLVEYKRTTQRTMHSMLSAVGVESTPIEAKPIVNQVYHQ